MNQDLNYAQVLVLLKILVHNLGPTSDTSPFLSPVLSQNQFLVTIFIKKGVHLLSNTLYTSLLNGIDINAYPSGKGTNPPNERQCLIAGSKVIFSEKPI